MSFAKANPKQAVKDSAGILYVLIFTLEDGEYIKIGITQRKIEDRVAEILTSFFHRDRLYPACYPKRFSKMDNVLVKEAMMHEYFKDCRVKLDKISGGSEFFCGIELDELLARYTDVQNGVDINEKEEDGK